MIVAVRGKLGISLQVEDYTRVQRRRRKCFPNLFCIVKGKVGKVASIQRAFKFARALWTRNLLLNS